MGRVANIVNLQPQKADSLENLAHELWVGEGPIILVPDLYFNTATNINSIKAKIRGRS